MYKSRDLSRRKNRFRNDLTLNFSCLGDEDGKFLFVTPPLEFYKVQNAISRKGYKILDSDLRYVPLSTVSLGEEEMEVASKLYQKLNEEPDVIKIYDNIA